MGGILQFLDFSQASTSRKFPAYRKYSDGLEAPRNSLEFLTEASQSCHVVQDDIPYSSQAKQHSLKLNLSPNRAPMKKLINEEMSNRTNTRRGGPNVVARLMGMDALPSETKVDVAVEDSMDEKPRHMIQRNEVSPVSSSQDTSLSSTTCKHTKQELVPCDTKLDSGQFNKNPKMTKPQQREHPQEELLQKFKKEFEAWQASKLRERSRTLHLDSDYSHIKDNQIIAEENLSSEKMARYKDAKRKSVHEKPVESRDNHSKNMLKYHAQQGAGFQKEVHKNKQSASNLKDNKSRSKAKSSTVEHLPIPRFDEKRERVSSPTRIVVLKPSSESDDFDESWFGRSEITKKGGSMEEFLQEVKERLRLEIEGKTKSTTRGSVVETSFGERSSDPKYIARHIAKQIRENVTRDLGTTLMRSESTRSYRSEIQFNELGSQDFINKDTRRILSDRLKNVLKDEPYVQNPSNSRGRLGTTHAIKEGLRLRQMTEFSKMGRKVSHWEEKRSVNESKSRSLGQDRETGVACNDEGSSPRNLIRSYSAPVAGTAFMKLLLEDQHVVTGAHIRRKHEASEQNSPEVSKNKKDGFSLKGKVSNFKQNLNLKGKFFGKKNQSTDKSAASEFEPLKSFATLPSVVMNLGIVQDNYTEVPPSPASCSGSPHEDLTRPGHPSPVSPLEAPFIEDPSSSQVSAEFSSEFPDLTSLSEQVYKGGSKEVVLKEKPYEYVENALSKEVVFDRKPYKYDDNVGSKKIIFQEKSYVYIENGVSKEVEIEEKPYKYEQVGEIFKVKDHTEGYVRDILVAAGLYEGEAFNRSFSRWDTLAKPIPRWVFEVVEETYNKNGGEDNAESCRRCYAETDIDHRMLFDLVNEALPRIPAIQMVHLSFERWFLGPSTVPRGRKLLDALWHQIEMQTKLAADQSHSTDSMITWDLKVSPWSNVSHEDIELIGREMEMVILGALVDEFVHEMLC